MPKLRVHNLAMSLDGYAAGPDQSLDNPLGVRGEELHEFVLPTTRFGGPGGSEVDERFMAAGEENIGATIMGRNMFGPIRGEWGNTDWKGWWGEEPPYHHPVFVLTHHPHDPIETIGTTFHFVTDGIDSALEQAFAAAGGQDVRLGGGSATIRQYVQAGLVDELHVVIVPIIFNAGERLLDPIGDQVQAFDVAEVVSSPDSKVTHVQLVRR
ncbi:MAG: dihydrofolate reductase family protein [Acidimicrobiales bacterium]